MLSVHSKYWCSPRCSTKLILRVAFGFTLAFVGIVHYKTIGEFKAMVNQDLGALTSLGTVWAYILPALMIIGGALLITHLFPLAAGIIVSVALGSIPAGMLLKSVIGETPLEVSMSAAANAFIWILIFLMICKTSLKGCCCGTWGSKCGCGSKDCKDCGDGCGCGSGDCGCGSSHNMDHHHGDKHEKKMHDTTSPRTS